jgi:hypothetical protein
MRSRPFIISLLALFTVVASARAQDSGGNADGLVPGDYLRFSAGGLFPINAQGALVDWKNGQNFGLSYENWGSSGSGGGPGIASFGIGFDYSMLPFNQSRFLADLSKNSGPAGLSATASSASMFLISTTARIRIPMPFIMPNFQVGFGYLDYRPGTIHYVTSTGPASASQAHRRGGAISLGAGLDKHIVGRFGLFGDAIYTYGITSLAAGSETPEGTCIASGCDALKNTTVGVFRAGLRVQTSR